MDKSDIEVDRAEGVKVSYGFDIPLSKDTYAKEKATVFLSFFINSPKVDKDELRKEARATAKELTDIVKEILKEEAESVKQSIAEFKEARSPEIDTLRKELSEQYEDKLVKAKQLITKLQAENEDLKSKLN